MRRHDGIDRTRRHHSIDYRRSLRRAMEHGDPAEIESVASRQDRTVDALLRRLFGTDAATRRELVFLADEVGLGKTFVALGVAWSVLMNRMESGLPNKPVLIVTPNSQALFGKWQRDIETFRKEALNPASGQSKDRPAVQIAAIAVQTPHELVSALCSAKPVIVVARMSAFSGRLHDYDKAIAATLHALFNREGSGLSVDQRLELVAAWPELQSREAVDLRGSARVYDEAEQSESVGFGERHVLRALRRLAKRKSALIDHIDDSLDRVRTRRGPRSDFKASIKELARAAMAERIPGLIPLVIVDEIHNWKNHPQSWQRFLHAFGGRIERMLGLSATPFQLDPGELIRLLDLRRCLALDDERVDALGKSVQELQKHLDTAQQAGARLAEAWSEVEPGDIDEILDTWERRSSGIPDGRPARIGQALRAAVSVESAHKDLMSSLRPFLVRHRRDTRHRRWRVGCDADAPLHDAERWTRTLAWRPGLDVRGDGELVHYLMMRATQESKQGVGAVSLGADLGGSYGYFREHELKRLRQQNVPSAQPYLDLVDLATRPSSAESHPKVRITVERAFNAWLHGEKTLIFCFNPLTVDTLRDAIARRLRDHEEATLCRAFACSPAEYEKRLENFQKRLYDYHQSLFLLFQDHPLAGRKGRVPKALALTADDLAQVARKLASVEPPKDRSRFDRRRLLAAAEQVLVARWQTTDDGRHWLQTMLGMSASESEDLVNKILARDWPTERRQCIEGVQTASEAEPFPDADTTATSTEATDPRHEAEWTDILKRLAARAVLAPYLADAPEIPSLLTRWHAGALHGLPTRHRALATRMLRRMVRSPGFLARFLLNETGAANPREDGGDEADGHWATRLHERWITPPAGGESAKHRFDAYLESLRKVVGHETGTHAYEESARNRDTVARVFGGVSNLDRDRYFNGFNTPLVPEVLVVTSVGQEGIDLHRECRHVIHHDLPWNPATLEQRTGRVDRIGSKAERVAGLDADAGHLDVVVPYVANTYDEFRFRRVHARAHLFEVTMGADYMVDSADRSEQEDDEERIRDDTDTQGRIDASVPLPNPIAEALRMKLEAEHDQT
jgi:hypothetical protein